MHGWVVPTIEGTLIPFLGTGLGAGMVFFLKKQVSPTLQKILTGFAAGVMVAASFWSLLEPALENSAGMGKLSLDETSENSGTERVRRD